MSEVCIEVFAPRALARATWLAAHVGLALLALGCNKSDKSASNTEASTGAEHAGPVACGAATCAEGQICCNPSCGICTPPDGMCTQQFCDQVSADASIAPVAPSTDTSCDHVRCIGGTHCEMTAVQCVRAPCPPVPECKPDGDAGT